MRRLQFKFPSQIRISGWDFGSSARAMNQAGGKGSLMTYEKDLYTQADLEKASRSTTERKSMSTKTSTIKRIALVAVAALGLGTISAVSANAAAGLSTLSWSKSSFDVGQGTATTVTLNVAGKSGADPSIVITDGGTLATSFNPSNLTLATGTNAAVTYDTSTATVTIATTGGGNYSYGVTFNLTTPATVADGTLTLIATPSAGNANSVSASTITLNVKASGAGATFGSTVFKPYTDNTGTTGPVGNSYVITQTASTGGYTSLIANTELDPAFTYANLTLTGGSILSTTSAAKSVSCTDGAGATRSATLTGATISSVGLISSGALLGADISSADWSTSVGCAGAVTETVLNDAKIKISTATAGTISATLTGTVVSAGVTQSPVYLQSFTIVVAAAGAKLNSVSAVLAKANVGIETSIAPVTTVVAPASYITGEVATVRVKSLLDGVADSNTAPAMSIAVTGVGLLQNSAGTVSTYFAQFPYTWSDSTFKVWSDSRSGTATITVTVGSTVKTFTVVFYGKVASVTAVPFYTIGRASSSAKQTGYLSTMNTADVTTATPLTYVTGNGGFQTVGDANNVAIAVILKDALGNIVPVNNNLTAVSSNPSVIQSGIANQLIDDGQGDGSAGFGYIHTTFTTAPGATSGSKASLTFSYLNSDGTLVSSTPVDLTVGGSVAKEVLSLDASSYEPGAPMVLTITATDSSGNPVYDGATGPTLSANKFLGGALPSGGKYVGGKIANKANKLFAPATAGDFTIYGAGTDAAATALSVTATVGNETLDAVNEATDAANAATDAANAAAEAADAATAAAQDAQAAVAALATQVASLIAAIKAQITSLTNLILKIKKKVRA